MSRCTNDLLVSPTIWLALLICVWMCFSKFRCWSIVTPISFSLSTFSSVVVPPSYFLIMYLFSTYCLFLLSTGKTLHLSGWNLSSHVSLHLNNSLRSDCMMLASLSSFISLKKSCHLRKEIHAILRILADHWCKYQIILV